jgi:serine/threonine protein kinase
MEYLCFEFSPFELSKEVSNLTDFLNYMDKIDGFGYFEDKFSLKIGQEISKGLAYLHSKEIAHRDLKAKNILVSNQHYCHIADEEKKMLFSERPIICKLADFGESRSQQIQTAAVHSTTKRVDRYLFNNFNFTRGYQNIFISENSQSPENGISETLALKIF